MQPASTGGTALSVQLSPFTSSLFFFIDDPGPCAAILVSEPALWIHFPSSDTFLCFHSGLLWTVTVASECYRRHSRPSLSDFHAYMFSALFPDMKKPWQSKFFIPLSGARVHSRDKYIHHTGYCKICCKIWNKPEDILTPFFLGEAGTTDKIVEVSCQEIVFFSFPELTRKNVWQSR